MRPPTFLYAISKIDHAAPANKRGGDRFRTDDLLRAKQVLSQLSYAPNASSRMNREELVLVGPG